MTHFDPKRRFAPVIYCIEVTDVASLQQIRVRTADYDGNGDANEGIAQEIDHLRGRLLSAIMDYAKTVAGKPVVYKLEAFPYFFIDTNGNGVADADETKVSNQYNAWTPRLIKAAYNYQFVTKDPGAFAHNSTYAIELLQDLFGRFGREGESRHGQCQATVHIRSNARPRAVPNSLASSVPSLFPGISLPQQRGRVFEPVSGSPSHRNRLNPFRCY